jgi:phosphoribosylformylglycinamidine synthase I
MAVRACVLTGFGINCDYETAHAFRMAGADAVRVHVNDLIEGRDSLGDYQILAFPGGFSFGDDIASGKVLATKCAHTLREQLDGFIGAGKLIIGICNGFQALVKMRILPAISKDGGQDAAHAVQHATLTFNDSGRFEDRWVNLCVNSASPCVWTKGTKDLYLPVRHGEGKFLPADEETHKALVRDKQIVVQYATPSGQPTMDYPLNPNGSVDAIAGVCDPTGRIFGLMPHPEGYIFPTQRAAARRSPRRRHLPQRRRVRRQRALGHG